MVLHLVAKFLALVIGFLPRGPTVAALECVKVECPEDTNDDNESNETAHIWSGKTLMATSAIRLACCPISGPSPIAARCSSAVLRSTVVPRRIAYPHHYADPLPTAVLRSIVFHPWSSPRLHSSRRIGKVTEQVVNIAISTASLVISRSPILVIGDVLSSFRGRVRS